MSQVPGVVALLRLPFAPRIWRVALLRNRGSGFSNVIVILTRLRGSAALQASLDPHESDETFITL
jgi:hypothetical protein